MGHQWSPFPENHEVCWQSSPVRAENKYADRFVSQNSYLSFLTWSMKGR